MIWPASSTCFVCGRPLQRGEFDLCRLHKLPTRTRTTTYYRCRVCGIQIDRLGACHIHTSITPTTPTHRIKEPDTMDRVQALQSQLSVIASEIARIQALPAEPDYDTNVIYFEKTFGRQVLIFRYSAVRTSTDFWYVTGSRNQPPSYSRSWSQLLDFIYQDEPTDNPPQIWVATTYEQLT